MFVTKGALYLPSPEYEAISTEQSSTCFMHTFADASFAPYRFNGRRGVSGGVAFIEGSLVRSLARQQQSVTLSSCEAELFALQAISQEAVAFSSFVHRVYYGLGEADEKETPTILVESDSASALDLLKGLDIPRRSRHVEVRISWLREKLEKDQLRFVHRDGVSNVADLFTKCLPTKDFERHRRTLGFSRPEVPLHDLVDSTRSSMLLMSALSRSRESMAVVEVCCAPDSNLRKVCRASRVPYIGVIAEVESEDTFRQVRDFVDNQQQREGRWIHVHCSTPCSSGSVLKRFSESGHETESDVSWRPIILASERYLNLGDSRSFELPKRNDIWARKETIDVLHNTGLSNIADIYLCQTGLVNQQQIPIGKCLRFCSTSPKFCSTLARKFGSCQCKEHAGLFEVTWKDTGFYNENLAKGILSAIRASQRDK